MTLVKGDYTYDYLAQHFTVRELRRFLSVRKIPIDNCRDKHDLIGLVMERQRRSSVVLDEEMQHSRHLTHLLVIYTLCICMYSVAQLYTSELSSIFTMRYTIVQSAVLRLHVVRPSLRLSVTLVDQEHTGWQSWKLIARTLSPTPSLFVAQRPFTYSQENMGKFGGE